MSEESGNEVAPLRLRRPNPPTAGADSGPTGVPPAEPTGAAETQAPVPVHVPAVDRTASVPPAPIPALFIPDTTPAAVPAAGTGAPGAGLPLRRRPTLAVETSTMPTPAATPPTEGPGASSTPPPPPPPPLPAAPLPHSATLGLRKPLPDVIPGMGHAPFPPAQAGMPPGAPAPGAAGGPPLFLDPLPEAGPEAHVPVKLRVGAKAPLPEPPPASGDTAAAAALPDDLFPPGSGAPLMPLPGLPSPGVPPPSPLRAGGGADVSRPPGTVPISGDGAALTGVNPLMPMPTSSGTRPPMPLPLPTTTAGLKTEKAHKAKRDLAIFLLGFLILVGVGGGAYYFFTQSDVAEDVAAQVKGKLEQAAELPGKVVANAKESMAEARGGEQQRVDAIAEGTDVPERKGVGAVTPAELENKLKGSTTEAVTTAPAGTVKVNSGGVEAYSGHTGVVEPVKEATPVPLPPPSARLLRYAEGLSVSGVFQGSPARALVNGRLIRSGEVIEPNLGVTFVGVEAEARQLILQEQSGAQVRVRY